MSESQSFLDGTGKSDSGVLSEADAAKEQYLSSALLPALNGSPAPTGLPPPPKPPSKPLQAAAEKSQETGTIDNKDKMQQELLRTVQRKEIAAEKARNDQIYLQDGKLKPEIVHDAASALKDEGSAKLRKAFDDIRNGRTSMSKDQIEIFYKQTVDSFLKDPDNRAILAADAKLTAELLLMADQQKLLTQEIMDGLGDRKSAVAARVVIERSKSGTAPTELDAWMYDAVSKEDWNDRDAGVGAQVFNALWNKGDFKQICKLITNNGVDPSLPHSLGQDSGRGSGNVEGIWSGFIQPLEHLLGNYTYKVSRLDEMPCPFEGKELAKVQGARDVLAALGDNSNILTDYSVIKDSPAMQRFAEAPGTIWGFEDVRLPYVQAAREVTNKDGETAGNQPLRMWELWKAIEKALNEKGYDELLSNPEAAIPKFVAEGRAAIGKEELVKNAHAYPGLDVDAFLKEFEQQATSFLRHLSEQIPKGQFGTAEISGMDPGKLMGGLGCKAGLWWAKENGKPVYYCIDGLNMDEALDYKAMKNKKITANLEAGGSKHFEVITFAEIREIMKNWAELKDTVHFIEKGKEVAGSRVRKWVEQMRENDKDAGRRPAPPAEKFAPALAEIDPELMTRLDKAGDDRNYDAMKIVTKVAALRRIARMSRKDVLPLYCASKCGLLKNYDVIKYPNALAGVARDMLVAWNSKEDSALSKNKNLFLSIISEDCSKAIKGDLEKWAVEIII